MQPSSSDHTSLQSELRRPQLNDGFAIAELVRRCGVLDVNSAYMYLLLCRDFADTCIVAQSCDQLVGFVTGYIPPQKADTYFLWQVGVSQAARGAGLAQQMILNLIGDLKTRGISQLETTITKSNQASLKLFRRVARSLNTQMVLSPGGFNQQHFRNQHEPEDLYKIGPF